MNTDRKILNALASAIESLENKRELGTITMDEEATLNSLVERAYTFIYNK
jgi:hypothetical protein